MGESVVGEICHIEADRPDGARYNAMQTPAERQGYDNLILMCPSHHKVIDDDEETYTVEKVKAMKAKHEASAGTLDDAEASSGAMLLVSVNQSGGVAAQSIGVVNYYHAPAPQVEFPQAPTSAGMTFFEPGEVLASVGLPGEQEFTFDTARFLYMRLVPAPQSERVGLPLVREVFEAGKVRALSRQWSGLMYGRNRHGSISFLPFGRSRIAAMTEGLPSGELWGVNAEVIQRRRRQVEDGGEEEVSVIPAVAMERMYASVLPNYVRIAAREFGLSVPCWVEFGAKGIERAWATFPARTAAGRAEGPIYQDAFRKVLQLASPDQEGIDDVLRGYFNAFYDELLGIRRADVFADDYLRANELPSSN